MENKFTGGEWVVVNKAPFTAKVEAFRDGKKLQINQSATDLTDEEAEANARLIAAAPELLDILIKIKIALEKSTEVDRKYWAKQANSIINKAKGE